MVITLIGHSGCGKSHMAKRLENERGFTRFCCDDMIEEMLAGELRELGLSTIAGVSEWLGQPYESQFPENQKKYLERENSVMREILGYITEKVDHEKEDVVIDTSGSVIYADREILQGLKDHSRIIYFAVPESEYEFMFEQYLSDPKPVIWKDIFTQAENETDKEALSRCYPELIRQRAALYHQLSDVVMLIDRKNRDALPVNRVLKLANARSVPDSPTK